MSSTSREKSSAARLKQALAVVRAYIGSLSGDAQSKPPAADAKVEALRTVTKALIEISVSHPLPLLHLLSADAAPPEPPTRLHAEHGQLPVSASTPLLPNADAAPPPRQHSSPALTPPDAVIDPSDDAPASRSSSPAPPSSPSSQSTDSSYAEYIASIGVSLVYFCADDNSRVRRTADECFNVVLRLLVRSGFQRHFLSRLVKLFKSKPAPLSTRMQAFAGFVACLHTIESLRTRKFAVSISQTLNRLLADAAPSSAHRQSDADNTADTFHSALASCFDRYCAGMMSCHTEKEIEELISLFMPALTNSSPSLRRYVASSMVSICRHYPKPSAFTLVLKRLEALVWPLEKFEDMIRVPANCDARLRVQIQQHISAALTLSAELLRLSAEQEARNWDPRCPMLTSLNFLVVLFELSVVHFRVFRKAPVLNSALELMSLTLPLFTKCTARATVIDNQRQRLTNVLYVNLLCLGVHCTSAADVLGLAGLADYPFLVSSQAIALKNVATIANTVPYVFKEHIAPYVLPLLDRFASHPDPELRASVFPLIPPAVHLSLRRLSFNPSLSTQSIQSLSTQSIQSLSTQSSQSLSTQSLSTQSIQSLSSQSFQSLSTQSSSSNQNDQMQKDFSLPSSALFRSSDGWTLDGLSCASSLVDRLVNATLNDDSPASINSAAGALAQCFNVYSRCNVAPTLPTFARILDTLLLLLSPGTYWLVLTNTVQLLASHVPWSFVARCTDLGGRHHAAFLDKLTELLGSGDDRVQHVAAIAFVDYIRAYSLARDSVLDAELSWTEIELKEEVFERSPWRPAGDQYALMYDRLRDERLKQGLDRVMRLLLPALLTSSAVKLRGCYRALTFIARAFAIPSQIAEDSFQSSRSVSSPFLTPLARCHGAAEARLHLPNLFDDYLADLVPISLERLQQTALGTDPHLHFAVVELLCISMENTRLPDAQHYFGLIFEHLHLLFQVLQSLYTALPGVLMKNLAASGKPPTPATASPGLRADRATLPPVSLPFATSRTIHYLHDPHSLSATPTLSSQSTYYLNLDGLAARLLRSAALQYTSPLFDDAVYSDSTSVSTTVDQHLLPPFHCSALSDQMLRPLSLLDVFFKGLVDSTGRLFSTAEPADLRPYAAAVLPFMQPGLLLCPQATLVAFAPVLLAASTENRHHHHRRQQQRTASQAELPRRAQTPSAAVPAPQTLAARLGLAARTCRYELAPRSRPQRRDVVKLALGGGSAVPLDGQVVRFLQCVVAVYKRAQSCELQIAALNLLELFVRSGGEHARVDPDGALLGLVGEQIGSRRQLLRFPPILLTAMFRFLVTVGHAASASDAFFKSLLELSTSLSLSAYWGSTSLLVRALSPLARLLWSSSASPCPHIDDAVWQSYRETVLSRLLTPPFFAHHVDVLLVLLTEAERLNSSHADTGAALWQRTSAVVLDSLLAQLAGDAVLAVSTAELNLFVSLVDALDLQHCIAADGAQVLARVLAQLAALADSEPSRTASLELETGFSQRSLAVVMLRAQGVHVSQCLSRLLILLHLLERSRAALTFDQIRTVLHAAAKIAASFQSSGCVWFVQSAFDSVLEAITSLFVAAQLRDDDAGQLAASVARIADCCLPLLVPPLTALFRLMHALPASLRKSAALARLCGRRTADVATSLPYATVLRVQQYCVATVLASAVDVDVEASLLLSLLDSEAREPEPAVHAALQRLSPDAAVRLLHDAASPLQRLRALRHVQLSPAVLDFVDEQLLAEALSPVSSWCLSELLELLAVLRRCAEALPHRAALARAMDALPALPPRVQALFAPLQALLAADQQPDQQQQQQQRAPVKTLLFAADGDSFVASYFDQTAILQYVASRPAAAACSLVLLLKYDAARFQSLLHSGAVPLSRLRHCVRESVEAQPPAAEQLCATLTNWPSINSVDDEDSTAALLADYINVYWQHNVYCVGTAHAAVALVTRLAGSVRTVRCFAAVTQLALTLLRSSRFALDVGADVTAAADGSGSAVVLAVLDALSRLAGAPSTLHFRPAVLYALGVRALDAVECAPLERAYRSVARTAQRRHEQPLWRRAWRRFKQLVRLACTLMAPAALWPSLHVEGDDSAPAALTTEADGGSAQPFRYLELPLLPNQQDDALLRTVTRMLPRLPRLPRPHFMHLWPLLFELSSAKKRYLLGERALLTDTLHTLSLRALVALLTSQRSVAERDRVVQFRPLPDDFAASTMARRLSAVLRRLQNDDVDACEYDCHVAPVVYHSDDGGEAELSGLTDLLVPVERSLRDCSKGTQFWPFFCSLNVQSKQAAAAADSSAARRRHGSAGLSGLSLRTCVNRSVDVIKLLFERPRFTYYHNSKRELVSAVLVLSDHFDGEQFAWMKQKFSQLLVDDELTLDALVRPLLVVGITKAFGYGCLTSTTPPNQRSVAALQNILRHPFELGAPETQAGQTDTLQAASVVGLLYLLDARVGDFFTTGGFLTTLLGLVLRCLSPKREQDVRPVPLQLAFLTLGFALVEAFPRQADSTSFARQLIQLCTDAPQLAQQPAVVQEAVARGLARLLVSCCLASAQRDAVALFVDQRVVAAPSLSPAVRAAVVQLFFVSLYTARAPPSEHLSRGGLLSSAMLRFRKGIDAYSTGHPLERAKLLLRHFVKRTPGPEARRVGALLPQVFFDFGDAETHLPTLLLKFARVRAAPLPQLYAHILYAVFQSFRKSVADASSLVVPNLNTFTQISPVAVAVWSLACVFVAALQRPLLGDVFRDVLASYPTVDEQLFVRLGLDFYYRELQTDESRQFFQAVFERVLHLSPAFDKLHAAIVEGISL